MHATRKSVQQRITSFLRSHTSRGDLSYLEDLERLSDQLGQTVIFGGFVRDQWLRPDTHFSSDLDIVVEASPAALEDYLLANFDRVGRTKFGGFRLPLSPFPMDLWCLQDTWAFRTGRVPMNGMGSLLRTTFFNFDAMYFDIASREIILGEAAQQFMKTHKLDVVLRANPNPGGIRRRIERYQRDYSWLELDQVLRDYAQS